MIIVIDTETLARWDCDTQEGADHYAVIIRSMGHTPFMVKL